jgi:hypothetical protein
MYVTNLVGLEQFQSLIIKIWQYEAYLGAIRGPQTSTRGLRGSPGGTEVPLVSPLHTTLGCYADICPRGVPGHVLVLKTYQDCHILQKCLRGLVVISEILQFRPSGPGPHGLIWSSGDRGQPPGDRRVVQRGTKVSQMFTLHVRNSLGWSASMWGHFKKMSLLGGHKGGALS